MSTIAKPSASRPKSRPADSMEDWSIEWPLIRIPAAAATMSGFRRWATSNSFPEGFRPSFLDGNLYLEFEPSFHATQLPVRALASFTGFCEWVNSEEALQRGHFSYLDRELVIDVNGEDLEAQVKVKGAVNCTIEALNRHLDLGEYYADGAQLSNPDTELSTRADATFVSWNLFTLGRVRKVPRKRHRDQFGLLEGIPDWVLEFVSNWSVRCDREEMREMYHRSRIPEYWIIDARGHELSLQILGYRSRGYVAVRAKDGWYKSQVFGRGFRLTRTQNRMGWWQYNLEMSPALD